MGSTMHPCSNPEAEVCGHSGLTEPLSFTDQMAFLLMEESSWDFRSVLYCHEGYGMNPDNFGHIPNPLAAPDFNPMRAQQTIIRAQPLQS